LAFFLGAFSLVSPLSSVVVAFVFRFLGEAFFWAGSELASSESALALLFAFLGDAFFLGLVSDSLFDFAAAPFNAGILAEDDDVAVVSEAGFVSSTSPSWLAEAATDEARPLDRRGITVMGEVEAKEESNDGLQML
jgi:hypothetical protein